METTPVIIGVGEAFEATTGDPQSCRSPIALATAAAVAAFEDAGRDIRPEIDAIVALRTYPDSTPFWPHPVTLAKNTPRAIARRIGINPRRAFYEPVGGQSPQRLIGEFAARLVSGEFSAVLITGGEAIGTEKAATRAGVTLDWSDAADGEVEDRGLGIDGLLSPHEIANNLVEVGPVYALFENARRARLGLSREDYARQMGELFEPFSKIASATPGAILKRAMSAAEIGSVSADNPMLFDPFAKALMAKDGVNMGAAAILTTAGRARALGVPEEKWLYLHGHCDLTERPILDRPDLAASPAMRIAYQTAMRRAGVASRDVRYFDLYSCFPIAVFIARDAIDAGPNDPRPLTMTGGLPFFGGPGNNYSLHAIAAMARALRADREAFGVVGANGGFLSKHAVGVYSATPPTRDWAPEDDGDIQKALDAAPPAPWDAKASGDAVIETYTVTHRGGEPVRANIVGRLVATGRRCLAVSERDDTATPKRMTEGDPIGAKIRIVPAECGNRFWLVGDD